MIKKGISLNKISLNSGIGKSTLYFHYKKIKGKRTVPIKFNFSSPDEIGEFLGIFAGDGSFYKRPKTYHYTTRVYTGFCEKHYADCLKDKFSIWFGKKPQVYFGYHLGKKSVVITQYYSKEIYELLKQHLYWDQEKTKTLTIKLKKLNLDDTQFNTGFLRGLIDTDGNLYLPKRRIRFSTISKDLSDQAFQIIKNLINVSPILEIYKKAGNHDLYTLNLHGDNAKRLINAVNPRNINKAALV